MKWLYTPRDPLWTACQRRAYQNLVRRAAANAPCYRDADWLFTALSATELTPMDFDADVDAVRRGETPPRLADQWPTLEPIQTKTLSDEGLVKVG